MIRFFVLFAITFCLVIVFTWLLVFCRRRRSGSGPTTTMCRHTGGPTCAGCQDEKPPSSQQMAEKPCRLHTKDSAGDVEVSAPPCPADPSDNSSPQNQPDD